MEKGINLDELTQEAEKLLGLLNDRQPGLITWNVLLYERLQSLYKLIAPAFNK